MLAASERHSFSKNSQKGRLCVPSDLWSLLCVYQVGGGGKHTEHPLLGEVGHADQTLPWHRGIPDLQDCIPLGLQEKCLCGQLRWQDPTSVPGTKATGQTANTGKGSVPDPAMVRTRKGQSLCSRGKPVLQGRPLMLQEGLSASRGIQCCGLDLVLQQAPVPGGP